MPENLIANGDFREGSKDWEARDASPQPDCPRCHGTGSIPREVEVGRRIIHDYTTCPCRFGRLK